MSAQKLTLPPPPKAGPPPPAGAPAQSNRSFAITSGRVDGPQRIVLYGTGGIGKTTLASLAPGAVVLDVEDGSRDLDVPRIGHELLETFADLRACLQSDVLDGVGTVVVDSATKVEELSVEYTLQTVKHDKGHHVDNLEGYGFGKGLQHNYDTYLRFLADLDLQIRKGRNVILIAHDCVEQVPNPAGDDWIRYEPHLQRPRSGKASIRTRVVQWADHVLYLGYDVLAKDGKARGSGTRTIYPAEMPTHVAKSRTLPAVPVPYNAPDDDSIWQLIFGGN